jgi:hypothetical protein
MYMFSISVNILSANIPFCVVPAAGRVGQAETERKFVGVSGKCIRDFTLSPKPIAPVACIINTLRL